MSRKNSKPLLSVQWNLACNLNCLSQKERIFWKPKTLYHQFAFLSECRVKVFRIESRIPTLAFGLISAAVLPNSVFSLPILRQQQSCWPVSCSWVERRWEWICRILSRLGKDKLCVTLLCTMYGSIQYLLRFWGK